MRRSYKFRMWPITRQHQALAAMLVDHREMYNAALAERRDAYRIRGVSVRYGQQSAQLRDIRHADPDGQGRWSFSSQQATLRQLNRSFQAFFRRVKAGEKPGYPRFNGAGRFTSVEWPRNGDGCRWRETSTGPTSRVYLQGVGHVKVRQHRAVRGTVKTLRVKREDHRWFLVLSCDDVPAEPQPATGAVTGIDMGVASLVTTSDGEHVDNPRHTARLEDKLAAAQRALSRCQRSSNRRRKARRRVAAIHAKIRRQRLDHAHKVATQLVAEHDVIAHEALRITNMTRSASGTVEQPGTRVAQKSGVNRSILDAGWGCCSRSSRTRLKAPVVSWSRSTPPTRPASAPSAGTPRRETASRRRCSAAARVDTKRTRM